ncbi:hypothetical protein PDE_00756 [Penicillium oxalicum 114-2]|uniref:Cyclin N-terminal domain-containing protein n=1 Tax=Penicillium oxalicum (strain 114-2 / CGMCC 5302) TaxID=933388 RepID=S7Z5P3_PENO1|nr:hypothetical protein PDE_00756 [Penicillium oxalicum 114-2]
MSRSTLDHRSSTIPDSVTSVVDPTLYAFAFTKPDFDSKARSWTAPLRDGLPTPPTDMTGIAYNAVPPTIYGGRGRGTSSHIYNPARSYNDPAPSSSDISLNPQTASTRSNVPLAKEASVSASETTSDKKASTSGANFALRVPSTINNSKGNLAEFAAQMTCLFWFEKTSKLQDIEERRPTSPSLVPEAIPTIGFQKWVASILSTTQVSQNVILLALLFIYRLKKFNSGVKGKKGSEFRLMTVALMLGNKFLDDNTYTNKTWAEVSGIAVQEIHIMEVEFLSNIRYDLYASKAEWLEWHAKLGLFGEYFDRASKLAAEGENHLRMRTSPPRLHAPLSLAKLPSPPLDQCRSHSQPQPRLTTPLSGLPYPGYPHSTEIAANTPLKRGRDDSDELHPAKRIAFSSAHHTPSCMATSAVMPTLPPVLTPTSAPAAHGLTPTHMSRLPMPNIPLGSGSLPQSLPVTAMSQLPAPALMQPAYPPASSWPQQMSSTSIPSSVAPPIYSAPPVPDISRHHQGSLGVASATVSPAGSAYSVHTPQKHLSPSYFLANRNSPYRPVHSVHTLLIPPPSASMQQHRSVPFDHMHYQPLGKSLADRKTGQLPYFYPDSWNQPHVQPSFPPARFSG